MQGNGSPSEGGHGAVEGGECSYRRLSGRWCLCAPSEGGTKMPGNDAPSEGGRGVVEREMR